VDGATVEALLKGPRLMTIELEGSGVEDGGSGDEGWGGKLGVPEVTNLSPQQRARIGRIFQVCDNLNCVPPRTPWPDHREGCRVPNK
jgi:hypothetical protein